MNDEQRVTKQVTVEVPDEKGKKWKLVREDDAVRIQQPASLRPGRVMLHHLREAVDALERGEDIP